MLICSFPSASRVPEGGGLSQTRDACARLDQTSTFRRWEHVLAAQAELLDESAIALEIRLLQVPEEPATPADELEQPAARVVVLRMGAEVLGQVVDALRQHRHLHLGRAGVLPVPAVLRDQLLL